MSITVSDVMRLPSMVGAEVVAGEKGIGNPVESVTVLEYGYASDLLDQLFEKNPFEGNELIITAFAMIPDNIEAQCANIRKYQSVGAVGMILFYVGLIMPEIDQRLLDCCNELGFPLISMPYGEYERLYADVINEVLFEVFRAQQREHYFVSNILDRLSGLPSHQRNIDTLLRMLSDHLHTTAVLTNRRAAISNISYWPRSIESAFEDQIKELIAQTAGKNCECFNLGSSDVYIQKCPSLLNETDDLQLYLVKFGEPLSDDFLWQSSEVVRLYIHIWNENHGKLVASELIRAIINDEPLVMNRLAKLFHIRVSDLNQLWIFIPKERGSKPDEQLLQACTEYFSLVDIPLIGYYDNILVACTTAPQNAGQRNSMFEAISAQLEEFNKSYEIICCDCLNNTAEVRSAYLAVTEYMETARKIYPTKKVLQLADVMQAKQCQKIIENKETLEHYRKLLSQIKNAGTELYITLTTYLLDAASNMSVTSKLLFVHLNTVKYRLHTLQDITGYSPLKMPDAYQLYVAVALGRILDDPK